MPIQQHAARSAKPVYLLLLTIALFLLQSWFLYGNTGRDDAFLTYWPAVTLAEQGEFLNYNSDKLEQSSTLLHTLTLATLHKLLPTVAMPMLAWAVSLCAAIGCLLLCAKLLQKTTNSSWPVLILATASSMLYWANSGMETLSTAALLTAIIVCIALKNVPAIFLTLCLPAAALVRPETALVLICFFLLALLLIRDTSMQKKLCAALAITTLSFAALCLWRWHYFGHIFPQPVYAKTAHSNIGLWFRGFLYLIDTSSSYLGVLLTAAGTLAFIITLFWRTHPQRNVIILCGSMAAAQCAFIIASGGDWMEASRFLLPAMPALLLCIFLFLSRWTAIFFSALLLLLATSLCDSWQFQQKQSTGFPQWERSAMLQQYLPDSSLQKDYSLAELQTKDALRDIPQLEKLITTIEKIPAEKPLNIMSIQMGFIPYHLSLKFPGQLQFLDLRALSTSQITRCALLDNYPRTDIGVKISYDEFFNQLPELHQQCDIQKPDIIYDMGYKMRKDILQKNGYTFIYLETRVIKGEFSRRAIGSDLFIAVRNELAEKYYLEADPSAPIAIKDTPPNIVLLLADDVSFDEFGFMGNTAAHTPTLDQLAQQGTVFTTAYVPSAFCRPTLASLLTGQWPHQSRIHANNGVIAIQPGTETLASRLQKNGYTTFAGGKFWEDEPEQRGFDSFDVNRDSFARKNQDALWQFIDQNAGKKPFFVWWAPMLPHTPHNPPQQFLDAIDPQSIIIPDIIPADKREQYREKEHNFMAMTMWLDAEVAKVRDKLAEKNVLENTLIVFMADNGFSHKAASKSSPYELGLRTPIIFHWPGHLPVRRIDAQTSTIHLFDTLLDYAGITPPPTAMDQQPGHSLRKVLERKTPPEDEKLFGASYLAVTLKTDPVPRPERDIIALNVRDGAWKYVLYFRDLREEDNADITIKSGMLPFPTRDAGDEELFFLPNDPYEQKNIAAHVDQATRIKDYRQQVITWWYESGGKSFDVAQDCPATHSKLCEKLRDTPQPVPELQSSQ